MIRLDDALDEVILDAVPYPKPSPLAFLGIKAHELGHAALMVPSELFVPCDPVALVGADDFHGQVRWAATFPRLPRTEGLVWDAEFDKGIRRKAPSGVGRVPIDELVRADAMAGAERIREEPEEKRADHEVRLAFGHFFLLRKAERLRGPYVTELTGRGERVRERTHRPGG
jgi:hypothetical protein